MRERAVNLRDWEVSAALAGRLTMLVRPMVARDHGDPTEWAEEGGVWHPCADVLSRGVVDAVGPGVRCPFGQVGDRLWARETFAADVPGCEEQGGFSYRADHRDPKGDGPANPMRWTPSIHMPRRASRLTLEITGVRVERLQGISEREAAGMGLEPLDSERETFDRSICRECGGTRLHNAVGANLGVIFDVDCTKCDAYQKRLRNLWEHTHNRRHADGDPEATESPISWRRNPWIWLAGVRRIEATEKRGAA